MLEVLSLWDLQSVNVVTAQKISNFLLIAYVFLSVVIKDGRYLAAFLLCEFISTSIIFDGVTATQYYLIPAVVYCYVATFVLINNNTNKIISCVIIVLFYIISACDDYIYREVETYFYVWYEYIFMAVHCVFIYVFIDWGLLRRTLGDIINGIVGMYSVNYNMQYLCYNIKNTNQRKIT